MSLLKKIIDFLTSTGGSYEEEPFKGNLRAPVCPTCNYGLGAVNVGSAIFHLCNNCNGIWVDKSSFSEVSSMREQDIDPYFSYTEENLDIRLSYMTPGSVRHCPVCASPMMNIQYDSSSGIWLDHCPHNHGIWLDAGEINLVLQYKNLLKEHGGKIPGQPIGMTEDFKREMEGNVGGYKMKFSTTPGGMKIDTSENKMTPPLEPET